MEDEKRPLVRIETIEGPTEDVPRADLICRDGSAAGSIRHLINRDLTDALSSSDLVPAPVHQDALQPRVEIGGIAESWKLTPCCDECFLRCVASVGLVAEDRPGGPENAVSPGAHQELEGCGVAVGGEAHLVGFWRAPQRSRHANRLHLVLAPMAT